MGFFDFFKKSPHSPAAPKPAVLPVRISDALNVTAISFFPAGPSKRQVLGSLIGGLDLPDPGPALKAILAREEAGSTVITPGIALPHARIAGIPRVRAALGLCPAGVQYSPKVEDSVQVILLFLGPADNMREHLAFLASVSALFQNETLVKKLLQQTSADTVLRMIVDAEKSL